MSNKHSHGHVHDHGDGHAHAHEHHNCGHDHSAHHAHAADDWVFTRIVANHIKIATVLLKDAPTIALDWAARQQPPHDVTLSDGRTAFLHLDESVQAGDRLVAEVNRWAIVTAAPEPVLTLTGPVDALLTAAVRLTQAGHPVMVADDGLSILPDPALQAWASEQGLTTEEAQRPFTPLETSRRKVHACDHPEHHHHHAADHGHSHSHNHSHSTAHGHPHDEGH